MKDNMKDNTKDNIKDNKITFTQALTHIVDDDAPLMPAMLYGFSMISKTDLLGFEAAWPTLETDKRQKIMRTLLKIAEQDIKVYFDPIFIFGLSDPDADVQIAAIEGLWENQTIALVPILIHLLKEGQNSNVQAAAATALGKYIYLGELEEIDDATFMLAEQALLQTIREPKKDLDVVRRAVESISYSSHEGIYGIIENAYYSEHEPMQISAIFAMGRSYDKRWGKIVISELDNDSPEVRFEATRACGNLELKEAVDKLIYIIEEDPDTEVQQNAIWALGQIRGQQAQEALELLADSPEKAISTAAQDALDELFLMGASLDDLLTIELGEDDVFDDEEAAGDYQIYNLN